MEKHYKTVKSIFLSFLITLLFVAAFFLNAFAAETDKLVLSISAKPLEIEQYTCGYYEESQEGNWYYYADINPECFVVSYDNGEEYEYDYYELLDLLNVSESDLLSEQSYENQWQTGEHTAELYIGDCSVTYTVNIIENRVLSISASDVDKRKGADGHFEYDASSGEYWFCYDYETASYLVNFTDGSVKEAGSLEELCELLGVDAEDCQLSHNQSYASPWKTGANKVTLTIGRYSCDYNVNIIPDTIKDITVHDFSVREDIDVYSGGEEDNAYFCYETTPQTVTVTYNDNSTEAMDFSDFTEEYGYAYIVKDGQSADNFWETGRHSVTLYCGDTFKTEYTVEVILSGIDYIEAENAVYNEYFDSFYEYEYIGEDDEEISWLCYKDTPQYITVHFLDGTEKTYSYDEISMLTGLDPICVSDQSYDNQWGIGKYTATLNIGTFSCDYTVEIEESTVSDIIFNKSTYKEGEQGSYVLEEDEDGNEYYYFSYYTSPEEFTVVKKDGSNAAYTYSDELFYETTGYYPEISDGQSGEAPWGIGTHTANITVNGKDFEREIEIVSNGITDISIEGAKAFEGINGEYVAEEAEAETSYRFEYYPEVNDIMLTINGEPKETTASDFFDAAGLEYMIYLPGQKTGLSYGTHTAKMLIGNSSYDFDVELKKSVIESITADKITLSEKIDAEEEYCESCEDRLWYRYNYYPERITVSFTDGTETVYSYQDLISGGLSFLTYDNQSCDNQWTVGANKARLILGGAQCEFTVEILPVNEEAINPDSAFAGEINTAEVLPNKKTFFSFVPEKTGEYSFFSSGEKDTCGWLYDSDFELIAKSDDIDDENCNFNIVYTLEAGKTYYFAVGYSDSAAEGPCDVTISGEICKHQFKAYTYNNDATCTKDGTKTAVCEYCIRTDTVVADGTRLGHDVGEWTTVKESACTEGGTMKRSCGRCEFTETESTPPTGHKNSEAVKENIEKPTCTEGGMYQSVVYCTVCETELSRDDITVNPLPHITEIIPAVSASCTKTGLSEGEKCTACDTVIKAPTVTPMLPHMWIEATCTSAKICSICRITEGSAKGHTAEIVPAVSATCTEKGYTEGKKCADCDLVLTHSKEISATGHAEVITAGKQATCTENGMTNGKACAVCGVVIEARKEISAIGHIWVELDGKKICGICNTEVDTPVIQPTTNPSEEPTTKPSEETTTKPSEEPTTKPSEEPTTKPSEVPTTKPSEEPTTKPSEEPTTNPSEVPTTKPSEEHTTKPSEETTTKPFEEPVTKPSEEPTTKPTDEPVTTPPVTEHKHTEIIIPAVSATYTKSGLTEGKKCSQCDEILVKQKKVARKKLKKATKLKVKKATTATVTLSWKKVTGADSYKVYYSTDGKKWKSIKVKKNSATIKKLKSGTQYRFKVRAFAGKYYGAASSIVKKTTKVKKVTLSSVKSSKKANATVKWKKVARASGYALEYSTSRKFIKKTTKTVKIKKGKTVKITLKKLKSGKKYYVRVKAYKTVNKKAVYGAYSRVKTVNVK